SRGGRKRSEISSRRQIATTAGPIRPSRTPCRELVAFSAVGNVATDASELEVEEGRLPSAIDQNDARQQQGTKRESWNGTPPVSHFKRVRPEVSQGTGDEQETGKCFPSIQLDTTLP